MLNPLQFGKKVSWHHLLHDDGLKPTVLKLCKEHAHECLLVSAISQEELFFFFDFNGILPSNFTSTPTAPPYGRIWAVSFVDGPSSSNTIVNTHVTYGMKCGILRQR